MFSFSINCCLMQTTDFSNSSQLLGDQFMFTQSCYHCHVLSETSRSGEAFSLASDAGYLAVVAAYSLGESAPDCPTSPKQHCRKWFGSFGFFFFFLCFVITSTFVQISCNRSAQISHQDESLYSCSVKLRDLTADSSRRARTMWHRKSIFFRAHQEASAHPSHPQPRLL